MIMASHYNKHHLDAASAEYMITTFANAVKTIPLMTGAKNEIEYHQALELIEILIDRGDLDNPLFDLLAAKIAEYENSAPEFDSLNQQLANIPTGIAVLRTIIDQYGLKTADLEPQLDSKSNVSNILNGRRALTVQHIKALSERFGVPADWFI